MAPGLAELRSDSLGWLMEAVCRPEAADAAGGGGGGGASEEAALRKRIGALAARVEALEAKRTGSARRAVKDARASSKFACTKWVAPNYYALPMRGRAEVLGCEVTQMCKTMLVENKQWKGHDPFDRFNAKHYLVVVQYAATFNALGLRNALAALSAGALRKSDFNFRVADEATMAALSGFEHNAVTPYGMREARVPVVLAMAAARAPREFFWMGGGHADLKVGVPVADFLKRFEPLLLDVSDARDEKEWDALPPAATQAAQAAQAADGASATTAKKPKAEKKKAAPANAKPKGAAAKEAFVEYDDDADTAASRLALVVGKIVDVWPHPESDKLFCEKIDCGDAFGGVRSIASGLQKFYAKEDLQDRLVLVIANLKAKKLGGFPSQGMVLCASNEAHDAVVFVDPPPGAAVGARVALRGLPNPCASDAQTDKKKLFLKAQPHFTTKGGACYYKDRPFDVDGAPCTAPADDGWAIS